MPEDTINVSGNSKNVEVNSNTSAMLESNVGSEESINLSSGAESTIKAVQLEKQLASGNQLTELFEGGGTVISQPAKQADRIAAQIGVDASNVQKVSSNIHIAKDGSQIQTHSFRDAETNQLIEPKSIVNENN